MNRIIVLDGLRGFLIILGLVYHYYIGLAELRSFIPFLRYYLSVLYCLSGFLICLVVLSYDSMSWKKVLPLFIVRRVLRIAPAYFVTGLLIYLINPFAAPEWFATFTLNIKIFIMSLNWENPDHLNFFSQWQKNQIHFWSVSVEEQFYITVPVLLFLIKNEKIRFIYVTLLIFLSIILRNFFMIEYPDSLYGALPFISGEFILMGCFFSLMYFYGKKNPFGLFSSPWAFIIALSIVSVSVGQTAKWNVGIFQPTNIQTVYAFLFSAFAYSLSIQKKSILINVLSNRIFLYLGKISYGIYLWQLALYFTLEPYFNSSASFEKWVLFPLLQFISTLILASLSWYLYEDRINRYRAKFK